MSAALSRLARPTGLARQMLVLILASLTLLALEAVPCAQQGQGPKCDLQFARDARRNGKVVLCFTRTNGAMQIVCINVDGIAGPVPPGVPTTPAEMATALCNAVNATPGLMCTNPGPDIVCVMSTTGTFPVKKWTVRMNDGAGGLIRNVGPGPTDPNNPGGPPPQLPPGRFHGFPRIHLKGTPSSPAQFDFQSHGRPAVSTQIPPGTPMDVAGQIATAALVAAGYEAVYRGPVLSGLGDLVVEIEIVPLNLVSIPSKILTLAYDETTSGPSNLGIGIELGGITKLER